MRRRSAKRAFTLIEMLAVIAIIMLVMAMALPNFMAMMEHRRWVAAISSFQNVVRRCRIFAINERRDYAIEFCEDVDNGTQYFRIEIESALLETTKNPEIVLKNKAGEIVRLQVLKSTGRVRKVR